jgi:hypothetical protein
MGLAHWRSTSKSIATGPTEARNSAHTLCKWTVAGRCDASESHETELQTKAGAAIVMAMFGEIEEICGLHRFFLRSLAEASERGGLFAEMLDPYEQNRIAKRGCYRPFKNLQARLQPALPGNVK